MKLQLASTCELMELLLQGFAYTWYARKIVTCRHGDNFPLKVAHRLRPIAVGTGFERVLALDFHEQCDLIEHCGNFIS